MIKRLIRNIIYWAFEMDGNTAFVLDYGDEEEEIADPAAEQQAHMEALGATFFCRARPGLPGTVVEHVHQTPNTEADKARARAFGWMCTDDCMFKNAPFTFMDGNGIIGRTG